MKRALLGFLALLTASSALAVRPPLFIPVPQQEAPNWTSGTFQYDGAGNIVALGNNGDGLSTAYGYDLLSRLMTVSLTKTGSGPGVPRSETYTYDPYGNIVAPGGWAVDGSTNRLAAVPGYLGYDVAGNLTKYNDATYAYDAENMLARSDHDSGYIDEFAYTADNERVGALSNGVWTWSIRDVEGHVMRQFQSSSFAPAQQWGWREDYAYAGSHLLAAGRPSSVGGLVHFHLDQLGSPRLITNATGGALAEHDYMAFGTEVTSVQQEKLLGYSREEPMKFTGHERDPNLAATGENTNYADYMHARYYKSVLGRFLSVDPMHGDLRRPQGWNRYAYVRNNPLIYTDPSGMQTAVIGMNPTPSPPGDDSMLDPLNEMVNSFLSFHWLLDQINRPFEFAKEHPYKTAFHVVNAALLVYQPELFAIEEGVGETSYIVYEALDESGEVIYVGITQNLERRAAEHLAEKGITIKGVEGAVNLTKTQARGVEQVLIEHYGLGGKAGQTGQLLNKINSIARTNPKYEAAVTFGRIFLERIGYHW